MTQKSVKQYFAIFKISNKKRHYFKNPLDKEIIRLSIPNIISNISIPLLGSIDLAIVGHLDSDVYIGAIALGTMIFNFLYWSFGFLRMGTSGISAQAYGTGKIQHQQKILLQGLFLALLFSSLLLLLQYPIEKLSFYFISGSQNVEKYAAEYFYIRIWAAPATLSLYVLYGWFLGMQNAKIPMIIAISGNIINLLANLLFVYEFNMKSNGVALGTVVAQYFSLIMAIGFLLRKYPEHIHFNLKLKMILVKSEIVQFLKLNSDIFIRTLCIIFVFTFFTSVSAAQNDEILAVNTLLLQFFMFFSFFEDGIAYAAEAMIGKFYGKKDLENLSASIKKLFKWGFIISLIFSILYYIFPEFLLHLLTNKENIIAQSKPFMIYILLIPVLSFASFIWDGIFIGVTAAKEMRNTMLFSTLLFFVFWFIFKNLLDFQNHSIWIAFIFFLVARGMSQTYVFIKNAPRQKVNFL